MSESGCVEEAWLTDFECLVELQLEGVQAERYWRWGQSQQPCLKWEEGLILLLGWFWYIHNFVQLSPLSISRTFQSPKNNTTPYFPIPLLFHCLGTSIFCVHRFSSSALHINGINTIMSSVTVFFHLACFQGLSML